MESYAFVSGTDRGLGFALTEELLGRGWTVVAGHLDESTEFLAELQAKHPRKLHTVRMDIGNEVSVSSATEHMSKVVERLDLVVNNAGVLGTDGVHRDIREGLDYGEMAQTMNINAFGAMRVIQHLLPLTATSRLKRLCFVSSEAGSIGRSHRASWFGYCMSKAALNMGVSILFNALRPDGYTFRVYHPGWMKTYMSGKKNEDATYEPFEAAQFAVRYFIETAIDEDTLVMRDFEGAEWPW